MFLLTPPPPRRKVGGGSVRGSVTVLPDRAERYFSTALI